MPITLRDSYLRIVEREKGAEFVQHLATRYSNTIDRNLNEIYAEFKSQKQSARGKVHPTIRAHHLKARLRILASPAVVEARMNICKGCPQAKFVDGRLDRCMACGCAGSAIAQALAMTDQDGCREGKWPGENLV